MKLILLLISLVLNLVAVGAIWLRPDPVQPTLATESIAVREGNPTAVPPRLSPGRQIETGDPVELRDRLRAAGFPSDLVKAIVVAHVRRRQISQFNHTSGRDDEEREFWSGRTHGSREDMKARIQAGAKVDQILRDLLGPHYDYSARQAAELARRMGPIAPEKAAMLERIQHDYRDLMMSYRVSMFQLPGDRAELAFLETERQADLAALLSPAELHEYELRTSDSARRLSLTTRAFDATEDEFRQLYSLWEQDPADRQPLIFFSINGPDGEAQRQQLLADAAAVLSPERLADLAQSLRPEAMFENLTATRLGLPLSAAKQLFEARMEVLGLQAKPAATRTEDGATDAASAPPADPRREEIWRELVATFGEANLKTLMPGPYGGWLNSIAPAAPGSGG